MYLTVFLIILVLSIFESKIEKPYRKLLYICSCLLLIGMTIFRSIDSTPWPDTERYVEYYRYVYPLDNWYTFSINEWEPGFMLLIKIIGVVFKSDRALIVCLGLLILIPIFWSFWKYSSLPQLSLLVFMANEHFTSTSIYRQWCAIAILAFSLKYIKERHFWHFFTIVVIAALFHRTAIFFLLAYFVYNLNVSNRQVINAAVLSFLIGVFGRFAIPLLAKFARVEIDMGFHGGITNLLFLWVCLLGSLYLGKNMFRENLSDKIFYAMLLIAVVMQPFALTFSLWSRVVLYFSFALCILIPNLLAKVQKFNVTNIQSKYLVQAGVHAIVLLRFVAFSAGEYSFMWG